jgi:hypothetical protein
MPIFKTSAKAIKIKAAKKLEQALKDLEGLK